MAASLDNRIRVLEQQFALLQRELTQATQREAAPLAPRQGFLLGVLTSELSQGGTATVRIIAWNAIDGVWEYPDAETITVTDYWLNDGESVPVDTKVFCFWYRSVWTCIPACAASDTLPVEEE